MYVGYFGLRERPFSNAPDPRFVYLGAHHEKALAHLLHGVQQQGGVVHLTGEIGNGKTTVCRLLLNRLPEGVDVALILNPVLTPEELLSSVCDELGVKYESHGSSRTTLGDAFYRHLRTAHAGKRRTVLIVDDAQNLGIDALEELRLLSNLEIDTHKLLQIVLIGQSELIELLGRTALHRLSQSITAGYHLLPFAETETCAYVRHRLAIAGGGRNIFEIEALRDLHQLSSGVPRLINAICDRALLSAAAQRRRSVGQSTVRAAARAVLAAGGFRALESLEEEIPPVTHVAVAPEPARPPRALAPRQLWPWLVGGGLALNALVVGAIFFASRPSGIVVTPPAAVAKAEAPAGTGPPGVQAPTTQAPTAGRQPSQTTSTDAVARSRDKEDSDAAPPMGQPTVPARPTPPARAQPAAPAVTIAPEQPPSPSQPARRRRQARATRGALWSETAPPVAAVDPDPSAPPQESTLRIEMLVWASDPKERMVFLNGRKYVEGQALENGAVIEQIAQDGVVLVHGGQRIRLPADAR